MTADRPKVGDVFRTLDRAKGLAGLLPNPTEPATEPAAEAVSETVKAPVEEEDTAVTPARSRTRVTGRVRRGESPSVEARADQPAGSDIRIVPIVLDASVLSDLRTFAVRTEQTQGMVTLRAIEAHADELAVHWLHHEPPQTFGRLFGNPRTVHRRTEPGVQTQVRLAVADAITLDQLVTDWSAPSRSALVNEALRRYVRTSVDNNANERTGTS
jgi:hypothetical protein